MRIMNKREYIVELNNLPFGITGKWATIMNRDRPRIIAFLYRRYLFEAKKNANSLEQKIINEFIEYNQRWNYV